MFTFLWRLIVLGSLVTNAALLVTIVGGAVLGYSAAGPITGPLVGDLYRSFVEMEEARILATIPVEDSVHVEFPMHVRQTVVVRIARDTSIHDAYARINRPIPFGMNTDVTLPAGTELPIDLDMVVYVNQDIPVSLKVPVDIPIKDTSLQKPINRLRSIFYPYALLFGQTGPETPPIDFVDFVRSGK